MIVKLPQKLTEKFHSSFNINKILLNVEILMIEIHWKCMQFVIIMIVVIVNLLLAVIG